MKFVRDGRENFMTWWNINLPTHCIACSRSSHNVLHSSSL